ncbi:YqeG family HAD IIIA-type phosphatase [Pediococcus claussenii]|uniref:HAD hydrolase, IA, variant 1 family protein n=1 Tax=Pediococcus claussenii (strain ATCC BAA-344 / DSM 14800 / JCM 18046 / KCTC 3811 / LMG 21948 / P06) TaxID=701521 RepID=G8PDQ7_PEDCP|nr:YqeG family HAD IIIA-type phosphatase [Pediococcus claussenii]AEV95392.1 HAD hydrolase, IA, variant 1 family protein [Pediococcus claussenii ATCC BAA-344]ANZ68923.1 HAD family hydrolase [Pediococcus claussenii]ANZ70739.1 HAD family hydrolase [Pediococcus claussenii]KRN19035.1 hypothetical protein IV79_GL001697 [Pediococcus claussenii]
MSIFKPTWMVERIYDLSADDLKNNGVEAVLTDLDNTLIAWNNPDGTQELLDWFDMMRTAGIKVIVVSNNNHHRVQLAVEKFGLPFESRALKPLTFGINKAIKHYQLDRKGVIMVGDQLITDMVSANMAEVRGVLVKPLVGSDAWNTRINRFLEQFIKIILKRKYPELKWNRGLKNNGSN